MVCAVSGMVVTATALERAPASANAPISPYPRNPDGASHSHHARSTAGTPTVASPGGVIPGTGGHITLSPTYESLLYPSFYLRDVCPIEKEASPKRATRTIAEVFI